jgi:hypothetical protein
MKAVDADGASHVITPERAFCKVSFYMATGCIGRQRNGS